MSLATRPQRLTTAPEAKPAAIHSSRAGKQSERRAKIARARKATSASATPAVSSLIATLTGWAIALLSAGLIAVAWVVHTDGHISPATGLGYALGIVGSVMMLSLLLYPLRKRWKRLNNFVPVPVWYTGHMLLGVLGPALVVVHSNFSLDSTNATVAMSVMLLMVSSGVFGRFIYLGLLKRFASQQVRLADLLADDEAMQAAFGVEDERAPDIAAEVRILEVELNPDGVEDEVLADSLSENLERVFSMPFSYRVSSKRIASLQEDADARLSAKALRAHWSVDEHRNRALAARDDIKTYFELLRRLRRLYRVSRAIRMWHLFHMPLFLLLIPVAIGHVIAVHLY